MVVVTNLHVFVDLELLLLEMDTAHGSNLAVQALCHEIFDQLPDHHLFHLGLIEVIRREAFDEFTDFLRNDLGRILDGEKNHDFDADGET
jgi:hypothetical protein